MPSPFPGMDPYLEAAALWPGVHQRLITYTADVLQSNLRGRYHVLIGERVFIAAPPQSYYPDVTLVQYPPLHEPDSVVAVAEPDTPTATGFYLEEAQRQPFIEIVHISSREVVTVLEILSPSNKSSVGREEYVHKQQHLLASSTHLVEIDLLRTGEHTVACPPERLRTPYHYVMCINRARQGWAAYAVALAQRLPRIGIPLQTPDADTILDLQTLFTRCYDNGDYADFLDYRRAPTPPLSGSDAAWVTLWLQQHGKG